MSICWVICEHFVANKGVLSLPIMRDIGPLWGSLRTWRDHATDNCVSNDFEQSSRALQRPMVGKCNLWFNEKHFVRLGRPDGIRTFPWNITVEVEHSEDLVALEIASNSKSYDIILPIGFDLISTEHMIPNTIEKHLRQNYLNHLTNIIETNAHIQYVFIDSETKNIHPQLLGLDNFSIDTAESVIGLLGA